MNISSSTKSALLPLILLSALSGCATKQSTTLLSPEPLPEPSLNTLEPASEILADWKTMQTRWQTERCERLRILKPSLPPCNPGAP